MIQGLPREGAGTHGCPRVSSVSAGRSALLRAGACSKRACDGDGGAAATLLGWSHQPPEQDGGFYLPLATRFVV